MIKRVSLLFAALILGQLQLCHAKPVKTTSKKLSGIYGKLVQIGFPPEHPAMGTEMPLPGMLMGVFRPTSHTLIKSITTGKDGYFKTDLPPGTYEVKPIPPSPDPLGFSGIGQSRKIVKVRRGAYTETKGIYDAGW